VTVTPPADVARSRPSVGSAARGTRMEQGSHLGGLTLVLEDLSRRYPTLSQTTIRASAVDVLCHPLPERLTPSTVARVLEARLSALL
jgi:hypothetical protein